MCRYVLQALHACAVRFKQMNVTFGQPVFPKINNCFEESGLDVYDPCDYREVSIVKYCSAEMIAQSPQQRLSGLS